MAITQVATRKKRVGTAIDVFALTDERVGEYSTSLERLKACWTREEGKSPNTGASSITRFDSGRCAQIIC